MGYVIIVTKHRKDKIGKMRHFDRLTDAVDTRDVLLAQGYRVSKVAKCKRK